MSVKDDLKKKCGGGNRGGFVVTPVTPAASGGSDRSSGPSPVRQDAPGRTSYTIRSNGTAASLREKYANHTPEAPGRNYQERVRRTMERDMQEDERSARDYDQSLADRLAELTGIRTSADELGRKIGLAGSYAAAGGQYDKAALEREREELLSKYGGESGLNELISQLERRQMDSPAVNHRLTRVGNQYSSYYDPNYGTLSGVDSSVEDEKYRWINDKTFRDEYAALLKQGAQQVAFDSGSGIGAGAALAANPYEEQALNLMTEDEVALYNYHFAKGGQEQADRYLAAIQDSLNYRKGIQMYANMEGDTAHELFFGVEAGLDQFKSGVAGLFDKGIAPTSAKQYASGMVREDLGDVGPKLPDWLGGGSLGQMGYDAVTTTANMAPSILTSTVVGMVNPALGGYAGLGMMSGSAAGNARQEKLREGYSNEQATAYGLMVGASEAVMEKLLGGISKLGGQGIKGLTDKLTSGAFTGFLNKLDNAFLRVAAEAGEKMLSEGTEEYLQEIIDPILRNVALGESNQLELVTEEALYSGLLGAITGGLLEGPGVIRGNINQQRENALKAASEKYGAQAEVFVQNYEQGQNPELYDNNYNLVFEEAKAGVGLDHVLQNEETAKYLSDEQIRRAWEAGKAAGGWSTMRESGESVKIKGVIQTESGFALELEDGRTVGRGDVILPTHSEELALRGIENLKVSAEDANALLTSFREGDVSGDAYAQGVQAAFQAGGKSIPVQELSAGTSAAAALSEAQRTTAYELGRKYAEAQVQQAQATLSGRATAPGRVHYDGDVGKLSEIQRSSVKALETVADVLGVQIHLFESYENGEGQRVYQTADGMEVSAPNGWYDTRTGDIHMDLNAGQSGRGTMMFTAAHELTHWVKQWSPAKFKALADFLMEQYGEKGVSVEELIERQQAKAKAAGHSLDYDAAFEELVADSMESMLADGEIVGKLAQLKKRDKSLWEKLKEKIAELVGKLKEAYKGLKPDSAEGKYVAEMLDAAEELKRLFAEGLEDASRNFRGERAENAHSSEGATVRENRTVGAENAQTENATVAENATENATGEESSAVDGEDWDIYDPSRDDELEFSMREPVEETKELVAVHNLSPAKLLKTLRLGGLPMPSIAITRAREGYNEFGEISLVFDKDTIDPEMYRSNKVYSGDAWTPVYPRVEHKVSETVRKRAQKRIDGLVPHEVRMKLGRTQLDPDNLTSALDSNGGDVVEAFGDDDGLKYAFLKDTGADVELPMQEEPLDYYNEVSNDAVRYFTGKLARGLHTIELYQNMGAREMMADTDLMEAVADVYNHEVLWTMKPGSEEYRDYEKNPDFRADNLTFSEVDRLLSAARKYFNGGIKQTVDAAAARKLIRGKVDQTAYEAWLREVFDGIVEKEGIRNNADYFTRSGNRRSFEALHYENTLENVIRAMKEQGEKGVASFGGGNIFGASTVEYGTIDDIRQAAQERMEQIPESEFEEIKDGFSDRFFELASSLPVNKGFSAIDDAANMLIEAVSKYKTKSGIANYLRREGKGWTNYSDYVVEDLIQLVQEIRQMPVSYFEAKPRRAVGFDEVRAVVMPSAESLDDAALHQIKAELENWGVPVVEYTYGDNDERTKALNSVEGVKFSKRDPNVEKLNRALQKENAAQKAEIGYLRELVGLQSKITKGTKFTRSSVEALAGQLMKEAGARGDRKELAGILNGVYEYIAGLDEPAVAPDWEDIAERTGKAAQWLMDHVETKQERGEYADEILKELRTMRISLNKAQVAEAAGRYGSYGDFRRAMFGSVILSKNGIPLDVAWQDLAAQYPGTFDANIRDADMPLKLAEIVAGLRDADLARAEFEADREGMAEDLRQKVYEGYWKVSTLRTVADKWQKKLDDVKSRHGYTMEQLKQAKAEAREADERHRQTIRELRQEKHEAVRSTEAKVAEYYQNARKKATEGRHKTAMRHRIERTVRELEGLLTRGSKERNVKEGMRSFAEEALASANVLFMDDMTDEELVLEGIGTELTPDENRLIDETQHLLSQKKDLLSDAAIAAESEAIAYGDTSGYDERMERLADLDAQINYRMVRLQGVLTRERSRLNKATVGAVLKNLSAAYKALGQSDDLYIRGAARQEVWEHLDGLIGTIGGTRVRDMTLAQLEDVYKAYRMVLTTVRDANKLFAEGQKQTLSEAARMAALEVTANGKNSRLGVKLVEELKKFGFNNLKPVYFFEHLNSNTLRGLYKGLMKGQDGWARDITEAREYYLQAADRHGMKQWDQEKTFTFRAASGEELKLNIQQMMSLYAYSRRPQARDHIRKGGVVIAAETEIEEVVQIGKRFKVKLKGTTNDATAYNIDDYVLGEIISKLTKEQKRFVEEMQNYLSDIMGGKGNEVSMELYGVKLFNEKAYFPLKSAHQYMARAKEQAEQTAKVKNAGFTKATQVKANNPVVLSPFMDVWSDHVNEMSLYHAMTLPLEDLHRVYTFAQTGDGGRESQSVTAAIENAFGSQATEYIDQLMKDLNSHARVDNTTGIINKSMALFKKGSTFLSASVVIQQPSAIVRATAMVDSKYFQWAKLPGKWALDLGLRRKQHDRLWAEVKQYAPVALIKEMGYFDTSVGRSTRDFIQAQEYTTFDEKMKGLIHDSGYRDEVLSRAPALADELAWCSIWEAVKREQHDKHPKMQVSSEEFLKLCGERFTEVIDRTQVYDSVLARSANMRSKDTGMKMATAFMAEPTVSANMAADAMLKGKRGDKKFCRRAIGSVISSGILNAMLYSLVAAARDDDEDKEYWEKYLGSVTGEVFEVINPATYLPFARDVWSLVQGYDVERSDMALVADLVNAIRAFGSDSKSGWEKVEQFSSTVFKLFGLPAGNILRDAEALFRTVGDAVDGQGSTAAGIGYAVMESLPFGKAANNGQQLYEATIAGDTAQIERVTARYKDASGAQSALRKALRENDPRIREAAVAWNEGRLEDYMSIARAVIGEKHFTQDDVVAAIRAEANVLLPDEEETETTVNHKGLFTAAAFAVAAADGDADMMTAIREDLIQTAVSNGKTEEAARKSTESSMKAEVKECVLGGLLTETQAKEALTGYCGMEAADAEETIRQWKFESERGYKWSERMDRFTEAAVAGTGEADGIRKDVIAASVAGGQTQAEAEKSFQSSFRSALGDLYEAEGVSDNQAISLLQKYGGKDADGALTTVRYWEFRRDNPGVNVDDSWIDKYYSEIQTSGMSIETYVQYRDKVKGITGTGKKEGRMAVIDSLPISDAQKDALYYSEGWAKSRIYEAPWH